MRLAHIADAAGPPCMLGCMSESRLALTAAAPIALSQRIVHHADLDTFLEHDFDPVIEARSVGQRDDAGIHLHATDAVTMPEILTVGMASPGGFEDMRKRN